jgi:DNA-binding CsgD family transcriptional regulator/PAS domain-containing protein
MRRRSVTEASLELVGPIYDCAINPERWPQTLRQIRDALECQVGQLFLSDSCAGRLLLNISHGIDDYWLAQQQNYVAEVEQWTRTPKILALPNDEPLVFSRDFTPDERGRIRYFQEWAKPQGLLDAAQLTFLRTVARQGGVAFGRDERVGPFEPAAIELLRTLAPHLRRAVQIGDLLEMKSIETELMASALDRIAAGVIVVEGEGRVVHANGAARRLLDDGTSVRIVNGRLTSLDRNTAKRLAEALRSAAQVASGSIPAYFGIRLPGASDVPCLAHVMPLLGPVTRARIGAAATAVVFITQADNRPSRVECLAAAFDLTPTELNVMSLLADGRSIVEAAAQLGIADSTARTHVKHLYHKTGVERQSELTALVHRLLTPTQ